jgi:hypothetical protein
MTLWRSTTGSSAWPATVEVSTARSALRRSCVSLLAIAAACMAVMTWGEARASAGLGLFPISYTEGGAGVEHSPHVYAIFWGSKWNEAPGTEAKTMLMKLYEGLSGSAYEGILTQYFDSTGRVGSTVAVTSYVDTSVTAPTLVTEAKIQAEVASAIKANGWTVGINNQFTVLAAPGSTYETGFLKNGCAYHDVAKEGEVGAIYGFIPYEGDEPFPSQNCLGSDAEKSAIKSTSKSASHEYAEMATDPNLNTWQKPDEIADACTGEKDLELPDGAWVQNLYDDHLLVCSHADLEPAHVYAWTKVEPEGVTTTEATIKGIVNAESLETKYWFEYGTTKSYGHTSAEVSAGSGITNQNVSANIKGLTTKTEYHFRVVAKNSTGTTPGIDKTFKTN